MPNMSTIDPSLLFAMLKGEPGVRKSTQALSFPKPQYWFSWDKKMQALMIPMNKWKIDPKLIDYDDYVDWNPARARLEKFLVNCPYKTLVFDSITSMADCTLRQTMKLKQGATRKSGQAAGMQVGGIQVNELDDYNAESAAISELVALTKDIHQYHKINIVLIAHVIRADYQSPGSKTVVSRTIVTAAKKIAAKIPAYCTEVYHFDIKKAFIEGAGGTYQLHTEHTGDDFARTALPLPSAIEFGEDPLYDKWIAPAIAKLKEVEKTDPVVRSFTQPSTTK